jgi:hypothetical protein
MRQVDGDDVPCHDQRDLRIPDEHRVHDGGVDLVSRRAEEGPAPPERVREMTDYRLALDASSDSWSSVPNRPVRSNSNESVIGSTGETAFSRA